MRLHAFQRFDGRVQVVAERLRESERERLQGGWTDLGGADIDLAMLSPGLVLGLGMGAPAVAGDDDALLISMAIATQASTGVTGVQSGPVYG